MRHKRVNSIFLLFPISIMRVVLPFFFKHSLLNDYIDLHIYGFMLSSFITGIGFFILNLKDKNIFRGNSLTLSVISITSYMLFHNMYTSSGNMLDMFYIIACVTLFFFFQWDKGKHLKIISLSIIVICTVEALYGIGQFFHLFRYDSAIKGSFDNPAGFVALLSVGLPFCFSFSVRYKTVSWVALSLILFAITFSGSRAGIISVLFLTLYYIFIRFKTIILLKRKIFITISFITLSSVSLCLFFIKQDSATGRILIWQNSYRMIIENPLWGSGKNSFKANYMLYQAQYFSENPESRYILLADNVARPFNEYLSFTIEFGLVGLLLLMGTVLILFRFVPRHYSPYYGVVIVILIFSCFSYPLYYPLVLLIGIYSLSCISNSIPPIIHLFRGYLFRICLSLLLLSGIYFNVSSIWFELQWKELIHIFSLGNGTEIIKDYKKLYDKWNGNPYFLYNYGVLLNNLQMFDDSNVILHECEKYFNDYDVQLLLATNYYRMQKYEDSKKHYFMASNMCPNRFIPLFQLMKIYELQHETDKLKKWLNRL